MKKNILITGSNGQLGNELKSIQEQYSAFEFEFVTKQELDITNTNEVSRFLSKKKYDYLINCAAYTAVDAAEENETLATLVNVAGAKNLATACEQHQIVLVHISTDYVFDGEKEAPYLEADQTAPLSVYGKSKLAGEVAIQKNCTSHYIVRTSWLYSSFNNNFVKSMLKLSETKKELGIVADQYGSPTYAKDLANAIMNMVAKTDDKSVVNKFGTYHYSNEGDTTWYGFATKIMELAKTGCVVKPIPTSGYPVPAKRPKNSIMSKNKIKNTFNIPIPNWESSLETCIKSLTQKS